VARASMPAAVRVSGEKSAALSCRGRSQRERGPSARCGTRRSRDQLGKLTTAPEEEEAGIIAGRRRSNI
jgi:hypothetical protein